VRRCFLCRVSWSLCRVSSQDGGLFSGGKRPLSAPRTEPPSTTGINLLRSSTTVYITVVYRVCTGHVHSREGGYLPTRVPGRHTRRHIYTPRVPGRLYRAIYHLGYQGGYTGLYTPGYTTGCTRLYTPGYTTGCTYQACLPTYTRRCTYQACLPTYPGWYISLLPLRTL